MALSGKRIYVGFGFGPIQAGVFLHAAYQSGNFGRLVVAEVVPGLVSAVRQAGGMAALNVAHPDRISQVQLESLEMENPDEPADRQRLIDAIAQADEIGTAVPSVAYYAAEGESSLHRILAQGLCKKEAVDGPRAVVYTAENNNHAAEILREKVFSEIPTRQREGVVRRVRFLNTVIGKMSQVMRDPGDIREHDLATITPSLGHAFLVEAFNQILISRIDFDQAFERGIDQLVEKTDLLSFEEAKLYGHNAVHALGGYLGALLGLQYMTQIDQVPGMRNFLRDAFIEETGRALIRKYAGFDDLFTPDGFQAYSDDLLQRMTNPYLLDTVQRVTRDPARKLGWNDRLIGTMRMIMGQGGEPRRFAMGAAAAMLVLKEGKYSSQVLEELWGAIAPDPKQKEEILGRIERSAYQLGQWLAGQNPRFEHGWLKD
jgi:mannitol-1-phosphate 5-dehydrogenase